MFQTTVSLQWTVPYWEGFRKHVHTILSEGYKIALPKIKADYSCEEQTITGFLVEGMREWILKGPNWCDGFYVDEEKPVPGKTRTGEERKGKNRQRPDIVVLYTDRRKPEFVFEAKRLRKKGSTQEYLSSEGMGCFINGEYSPNYSEAGMLGYIEIETLQYWNGLLKKRIDENKNSLFLVSPQKDICITPDSKFEWKSSHFRNSLNSKIDIFHILLDCRP